MTELTPHGLACLIFAALVFALFVWDRLPISTVCLGVIAALPLGFALYPLATTEGPVDPLRFFAGFGNPALVAICALMIVGQGLVVTGAMEPPARRLAGFVGKYPVSALLLVLGLAAAASGVVNDTPVVVLLIPLLLAAARQAKVSAAGMLLPMNYAVLIGGMATTIGTSTNLIVVAIAISIGAGPFPMFGHFDLVAMAAVPALLYLWIIAPRLLAGVPVQEELLSDDVFDAELHIDEDSKLAGKALREALAAAKQPMRVVGVLRGGRTMSPLPTVELKPGDRLVVRDTAVRLKQLEGALGADLHDVEVEGERADSPERTAKAESASKASSGEAAADKEKEKEKEKSKRKPVAIVAQMIVTAGSSLEGRSVRRERLADRYGFVVVGVRSATGGSSWQRTELADRTIALGDVLLLQGDTDEMRRAQRDGLGLLLDERFTPHRQHKAPIAILTMAVVVLLAATKLLPIALAALTGAVALLLTRCLSWDDIRQSLSTKVILLVAASLALGDALVLTGATAWLAQQLAGAAEGMPSAWLAALLMALMGLVTNFVSNNAAAAIGTPLGVSLAQALGVPPEPFVLAVLFGCNLCYLTPMGYQTNLLVMNAAGYRFGDFLRVGAPLFVIMWAGLSWLLAVRYGL